MTTLSIYRPLVVNDDGTVRKMTRGDCIEGTAATGSREDRMCGRFQCRVYACRKNLMVTHSEDSAGRRHNGLAPPWTFSGNTDATSPSCALDVADTGPKSSSEVAKICGTSTRRIEQILKAALKKDAAVGLYRLRSSLEDE